MALAANALTTLSVVQDELGVDAETTLDTRLERYINAASAFIAAHCGRVFVFSENIVERVPGFGSTRILIARAPVLAIASVVVDGATLGATEYAIENADAGIIYRATGWPNTAPLTPTISEAAAAGQEDPTRIVVTYDGGYITPAQVEADAELVRTLPYDLEDACVELVTARHRARGTSKRIAQETAEAKSYTFGGLAVPREILATLERYSRFTAA